MAAPTELPLYRCHKLVRAGLIASVSHPSTDGSATLTFEGGLPPKRVSGDYTAKHQPYKGGYFVLYDDGYESFSPPGAFENGYTLEDEVIEPPPLETTQDRPTARAGELVVGKDGVQLLGVRMIHGEVILVRREDVEEALKVCGLDLEPHESEE